MTTIKKIDAKDRELLVNVWPKSERLPAGQIEIYTSRGKSVMMTLAEWDEFNGRITSARSLKLSLTFS